MIEGEVTVKLERGQLVNFNAGDLVSLPAGMNWRKEFHKAVCNHYRFGNY